MIVTLIYEDRLYTVTLPEKKEGQFFLGTNSKKDLIRIIGEVDSWVIKSNKKVRVLDNLDKEVKTLSLQNETISRLKIDGKEAYLFCEQATDDRRRFQKFIVDKDLEITIGRNDNNLISYRKPVVSSNHAVLTYRNKYWFIEDKNSTNGTFVNQVKIEKKDLEFGDVIYIMGLKIILGYDFIAINNPDNLVVLDKNSLSLKEEVLFVDNQDFEDEEDDEVEVSYFYRSPRLRRKLDKQEFKIDPPPTSKTGEKIPLALSIGPMLTMGLASLTSTGFSINNAISSGNFGSHLPSIAMSGSMLLGTLLWPLVTKGYDGRIRKKYDKVRSEKYLEYLKKTEEDINKSLEEQSSILKETLVTIDECEDRILKTSRTLWERNSQQEDFLKLRIGVGDMPSLSTITYPERSFSIEEDDLLTKMYELCESPKVLKDVPIALSLYENYFCGVIGNQKKVLELAKGFIIELAALYSYDELKMIFIYNEEDQDELNFVKWLPHTFSDDKKFRFIATNNDECKELSYYLDEEILFRIDKKQQELEDVSPYYVVFVLDKKLGLKTEFLNQLYSKKRNLNFSVLNFYSELQDLPKECNMVVELSETEGKMYDKNNVALRSVTFKPDIYLTANPVELSKKLANTYLDTLESGYQLPAVMQFLEMFEVGKLEHLNVLKRWKENDPTKSLSTPIGVNSYGELFQLDLHEKFHGPHGLVAGMTGSGKSEFIMTYILSLAVNYHPHEVSFILIDYKGGGMAKSFEKLPHTAGIITNLDGSSINRALTSINSELKRRQTIFEETSRKTGISNLDIYKYQKLYREKTVDKPLPHLFIISDEFAELKSERPEFMSKLISAARIGRSLGVHLILATQKPSGVVDDQIWSNSKFRVCLKVQEKSDSMDMLKRPDAAMLKDTGRFYLQVGYNELFELGQSAWAGASYYPKESFIKEKDDSVVVIDKNARILKAIKPEKRDLRGKGPKQLDAITDYLYTTSKAEKIKPLPIWLPPLKEDILLKDLLDKYKTYDKKDFVLNPIIGELDDPVLQRQTYLSLPISEKGNILIYGSPGSGKGMLLNTLVYSLVTTYAPEEVNLYLLDFESETLRAFKDVPHVGEVILSNDNEKITNLLKKLYQILDTRKKEFYNFGGSYNSYILESKKSVPNIVMVISNYAAFIELYPEKEEFINYLVREGSKYGIYLVVTTTGMNSIKYKIAQNFGQVLALNFNDESQYSLIFGRTEGLVPSHVEGRGLIKLDKTMYEFQTAKITLEANSYSAISNECSELSKKHSNYQASRISVLPSRVTQELVKNSIFKNLLIPVGIRKDNLEVAYLDLDNNYINLALSTDKSHLNFIKSFANFISTEYKEPSVTVIDIKDEVQGLDSKVLHITSHASDISDELYQLVLERNNKYKAAIRNQVECEEFEPKIYIINSFADLIEGRSSEEIEKIELALEKGQTTYKVYFIIFENPKKATLMSAKKWYQSQVKLENGLWFGNGFNNQYLYSVSSASKEAKGEIKDGDFAVFINKGKANLVKVLSEEGDSFE